MTSSGFLFLILVIVVILLVRTWLKLRRLEREQAIRSYSFPREVVDAAFKGQADITPEGSDLAGRALRQFFLIQARAGEDSVVLPSKAAETLWQAFAADSKAYKAFCDQAFGQHLNPVPEAQMRTVSDDRVLWRTWQLACEEENIDPARASRLPLLYAIDDRIGQPGAVSYRTDSFKRAAGASDSSRRA